MGAQATPSFMDMLGRGARELAGVVADGARSAIDPDRALQLSMAGLIEAAHVRAARDPGATWRPGAPLRLLFAGYSGTRNTGADVRVEEMIRQFRHLIGDANLELSILTIDPALSRGYFRTARQLHLPQIFPKYLFDVVHEHHGVVACEGSMFKSKFANALATMMVGSLGLAAAEGKLAIGYGGEAGSMDPSLEALVARYCKDSFLIVRNEESRDVLSALGIASKAGTDTAWTFDPASPTVARELLSTAGWDGTTPILAVAPINPFWWPVRPDLRRGIERTLLGLHGDAHYASIYFHAESPERRAKQAHYLDALESAIVATLATRKMFPIVIGMEQLDRKACEALSSRLARRGINAPLFVSDDYDMRQMVAIVRTSSLLVASRYHALVTSMPASVPSVGVTMDERIRNLMADRGQPELCLGVDDADLAPRLTTTMRNVLADPAAVCAGIERAVVANLERMGRMGIDLVDHLRERLPALPIDPRFGGGASADPWRHLPSLPPVVEALVARTKPPPRTVEARA